MDIYRAACKKPENRSLCYILAHVRMKKLEKIYSSPYGKKAQFSFTGTSTWKQQSTPGAASAQHSPVNSADLSAGLEQDTGTRYLASKHSQLHLLTKETSQ